jgi:hypothetical protein
MPSCYRKRHCRWNSRITNKSMPAMLDAWLRRKVRHSWLGGPRRLTIYLATLDWPTSNPNLRSSPWMRGAPKRIFDAHPPDPRSQVRLGLRPPSRRARLPAPIMAKACPMPMHERLGADDHEDLQD